MNLEETLAHIEAGRLEAAEALCRQQLDGTPDCADAYHLLGHIRRLQGDFHGAVAAMQRAALLFPTNAVYFNNLGSCYLQLSNLPDAEKCFNEALRLDPGHQLAKSNLQLLRQNISKASPATIAPNQGSGCGAGDLRMRQQDFIGALAEYDQHLTNHPATAPLLFNRATCMFNLNHYEDALAALDPIVALDAAFAPQLMRRRGDVLQILGRLDEACAAYDSGIEMSPGNVSLLFSRAHLRRIRRDEQFFQFVRNFEPAVERLSGRTKATVCYAIGKTYADVGETDKAATYYTLGAQAIFSTERYNEAAEIALDEQIRRLCTPDLLARRSPASFATRKPFFIVGMPRSGTTLVEQVLASHPGVYPGGELTFWAQALRALAMPDPQSGDIRPTVESLSVCATSYLSMLEQLPGTQGYAHITDKLPANYRYAGLIAASMPDATIVHCRRSPIDTALSCYVTLFTEAQTWTYDFKMLGRAFRRYWGTMEYWRQLIPGRLHEIRYESIIVDQENESRSLLIACGLEWDARVLRFHETQRPVATASVSQVRQPLYASSSGRWIKWKPYIQPLLDEMGDLEIAYWDEVGVKVEL